jgi:predicted ABC-type ATPase
VLARAALAAGRLFLLQLERLARSKDDFAFESTLSGLSYLNRLKRWKAAGWRIEIVYLRIRHRVLRDDEFPPGLNKAAIMCPA